MMDATESRLWLYRLLKFQCARIDFVMRVTEPLPGSAVAADCSADDLRLKFKTSLAANAISRRVADELFALGAARRLTMIGRCCETADFSAEGRRRLEHIERKIADEVPVGFWDRVTTCLAEASAAL